MLHTSPSVCVFVGSMALHGHIWCGCSASHWNSLLLDTKTMTPCMLCVLFINDTLQTHICNVLCLSYFIKTYDVCTIVNFNYCALMFMMLRPGICAWLAATSASLLSSSSHVCVRPTEKQNFCMNYTL